MLSFALSFSSIFAEAAEDLVDLGFAFAFVAVAGLFLTPEPVHGMNPWCRETSYVALRGAMQ